MTTKSQSHILDARMILKAIDCACTSNVFFPLSKINFAQFSTKFPGEALISQGKVNEDASGVSENRLQFIPTTILVSTLYFSLGSFPRLFHIFPQFLPILCFLVGKYNSLGNKTLHTFEIWFLLSLTF